MENSAMRIMLVTYRFGDDIPGGAERHLWELMTRLARKGHQVEVFTTRCRQMIPSPFGYLLWDNTLAPGMETKEGMTIHRFGVRNPRPGRARRRYERIKIMTEREREAPEFAAVMQEALRGLPEHCFLCGWHERELWEDGPARWTKEQARLVASGVAISGLALDVRALQDTSVMLRVSGEEPQVFTLQRGNPARLEFSFTERDSLTLNLENRDMVRPMGDERQLGVAVRGVELVDRGKVRELGLHRDWNAFVENGPEEAVGAALWSASDARPGRACRWQEYLIGPRSPSMEREVMRRASGFDVVLGAIVPMATLHLAWKAAHRSGKPFVAFPLFHPRDPNHYWGNFKQAMVGAAAVEGNSTAIAELMRGWGFKAFSVGPGFDFDEWSSPSIDGDRFRKKYDFEGRPLLLWVARKTGYKGYREAIEALGYVRGQGYPAALVMIGPDEDFQPVSGEGVYYMGTLPRKEVLDAYDACDIFIFPSLHESFCMVFCEAWLRGKPVLGSAYSAAARSLIQDGRDGYLCREAEEYGRRALELLKQPEKACEMGRMGREKVYDERGWDKLTGKIEDVLSEF
jgi:glycosyltransferase involved in cell wall biosynthesis